MKTINEILVLRNYIKNILGKPLESNYKSDLIYPLLTFVTFVAGLMV
jgi:hypothetical protein